MSSLLQLRDLRVRFATRTGRVEAVRGVSLDVPAGAGVAIVGESGSGKSQAWLACAGLLAGNGVASGSVRFDGREILNQPDAALQRLRGPGIGFVFQDALASLTPHLTVGEQLVESLRVHRSISRPAALEQARQMLERVQVADARHRLSQYPHELSGGTRQRVAIAAALMPSPRLLVADEPTTALDVTVQAQVIGLLRQLRQALGMALVIVTHDLGVVAGLTGYTVVMYAGRVVEAGPTAEVIAAPRHPYTAGLMAAVPRLDDPLDQPMRSVAGIPPHRGSRGSGCPFAPRCPYQSTACLRTEPGETEHGGRRYACHHPVQGRPS